MNGHYDALRYYHFATAVVADALEKLLTLFDNLLNLRLA